MAIDIAMGYELVDDWLPDFIAWAENPTHVLADDLLVQAKRRVWDNYDANTEYDDHRLTADAATEQIDYAAHDVTVMLQSVAEWIVANREIETEG